MRVSGRTLHPLPLAALLLAAAGALRAAAPPEDPLNSAAEPIELDEPDAPALPVIPVNTLFKVPDGDAQWTAAYQHATQPLADIGGLPSRSAGMTMEGFKSITGFRAETYTRGTDSCDLLWLLAAEEAVAEGNALRLTGLRLVYILTPGGMPRLPAASKGPGAGPQLPSGLRSSRFVLSARQGALDVATSEGRASGGVRLEIFGAAEDGTLTESLGWLTCDEVRWRAWSEPSQGTSEFNVYAVMPNDAPGDPPVTGRFFSKGPDGAESHMDIRALGMIFESSLLDRLRTILDEQGRPAGVTKVIRRRALFRRRIQVTTEGSGGAPLLPFQQAPVAEAAKPPKGHARAAAAKAGPEPGSRTVVKCRGPSILDLAVLPRNLDVAAPATQVTLLERFEFLNGVDLDKFSLPPPPAKEAASAANPPKPYVPTEGHLSCRHLCFQYGAATLASLPDYAEALGGVRMHGTRQTPDGLRVTPYSVDCQRVYFDGPNDVTYMEGLPGARVEIVDDRGQLLTQACLVSRKTQMLYMPDRGPKHALVKATTAPTPAAATPAAPAAPTPAAAPTAGLDLGGTNLEADWQGSFRREAVRILAGAGQAESIKEVLNLKKEVVIRQVQVTRDEKNKEVILPAENGLRIEGESINIVRDEKSGQVERLEGRGKVLVRSGDMQVKGDSVIVSLRYGAANQIVQNNIVVWSDPEKGGSAVLWQDRSAVRSSRFVIDALNNNFQAYGGVVALVAMPAPEAGARPPEAAGGAAFMPGFSAAGGGRLGLQCDGDFEFDGGKNLLHATRNVLIHQEDTAIVADQADFQLETQADQPAPAANPKTGPGAGAPKGPPPEAKPPQSGGALFSGNVKSVECRGRVEVTSPTQVVHCDRLYYDMPNDRLSLETDSLTDVVRVYLQEPSGGTRLLQVICGLTYDGKTGIFTPAEPATQPSLYLEWRPPLPRVIMKPYPDKVPLPRGTPPASLPGGGTAR